MEASNKIENVAGYSENNNFLFTHHSSLYKDMEPFKYISHISHTSVAPLYKKKQIYVSRKRMMQFVRHKILIKPASHFDYFRIAFFLAQRNLFFFFLSHSHTSDNHRANKV